MLGSQRRQIGRQIGKWRWKRSICRLNGGKQDQIVWRHIFRWKHASSNSWKMCRQTICRHEFQKNIVVGGNIFCLRDKFAKSGESFADGRKPNIIINGYSSRTFKIALRRFSRFVAEYEFMSKMYINIFQPRKKVVRFGYSTENK